MRVFLLVLALLLLGGCASTREIYIRQPTVKTPGVTGVPTAGAVSIDITPPPWMPMGGYSILANKGQGFRTRIKARVIYLNDGKGHSVALVQMDLPAGSLLLHHKVAEAVAETTGLRPGDIAITASHSHSAPVNFFDNDFYNKHMSSGKWLERAFLEFATQRIAQGLVEAYQTRRPARIAVRAGHNALRAHRGAIGRDNVHILRIWLPESGRSTGADGFGALGLRRLSEFPISRKAIPPAAEPGQKNRPGQKDV